ncbi:MAG: DUF4215 domain-containing protein [Myxococcales bacterium]|nr:DUF4215 domain-containing protein [Myxococcales bacterium]
MGGDTGTLNSWTLLLCVDPAAPYCGDGATGPAEECDDGNTTNTDACSNVCTIVDGCGDGNLDAGETCDDDNIASGDGCSATCQVEPNYLCSGTPSVCVPVICGDGIIAGTETCDDGNTTASDGCSAACAVEAGFYCGSAPSLCRPTPTTVSLACTDMTGATTLNATGDDVVSAAVALPFAYTLYGTAVTHFRVSSNGYLGLVTSATGTVASAFSNTTLPTTATPNGMLAPFWDDLDLTGTGTRYLVTGAGPTQKLTIEWNALTFSTVATLVFQAQLTPDGFVEYHYCSGTGDAARASGSSATIGAENLAGTVGRAFSFNVVNSVTPGTTALRWDVH